MKNKLYIILTALSVLILALSVFLFLPYKKINNFYINKNQIEVDFLNVGQGDSILIKTPFGQNIIIDGGPDRIVMRELSKVLPWWENKIDLMILTHPHADHVTGLNYLFDKYFVDKVLYTGVSHTAPSYLDWLKASRDKNAEMLITDKKQKINLGPECFLEILYPTENLLNKKVSDLNDSSMIIRLVYADVKFLFMGDAGMEIEKKLLENEIDLRAQVLKVSHHGSAEASSAEFLKEVNPQFSVIQVGIDNEFGHPQARALNRIKRAGSKIYRNDADGLIKIFSDGKNAYVD